MNFPTKILFHQLDLDTVYYKIISDIIETFKDNFKVCETLLKIYLLSISTVCVNIN